jgi:small subunit ribosomal protein S2
LRRERKKITRNLEGIRNMKQLPGSVVVVDIRREYIAVSEAKKLGIPVIGIVDTDCDPTEVDIVIPGNDDAYRSVQQILQILTDSVVAGRDKFVETQAALEKARQEEEERSRSQAAASEAARRREEAQAVDSVEGGSTASQ